VTAKEELDYKLPNARPNLDDTDYCARRLDMGTTRDWDKIVI